MQIQCPNCGAMNSKSANYCSFCYKKLDKTKKKKKEKEKVADTTEDKQKTVNQSDLFGGFEIDFEEKNPVETTCEKSENSSFTAAPSASDIDISNSADETVSSFNHTDNNSGFSVDISSSEAETKKKTGDFTATESIISSIKDSAEETQITPNETAASFEAVTEKEKEPAESSASTGIKAKPVARPKVRAKAVPPAEKKDVPSAEDVVSGSEEALPEKAEDKGNNGTDIIQGGFADKESADSFITENAFDTSDKIIESNPIKENGAEEKKEESPSVSSEEIKVNNGFVFTPPESTDFVEPFFSEPAKPDASVSVTPPDNKPSHDRHGGGLNLAKLSPLKKKNPETTKPDYEPVEADIKSSRKGFVVTMPQHGNKYYMDASGEKYYKDSQSDSNVKKVNYLKNIGYDGYYDDVIPFDFNNEDASGGGIEVSDKVKKLIPILVIASIVLIAGIYIFLKG